MILQEISKEDALRRYLDGENIQVLRPTQSGRLAMWSMEELFQGSRFLIESANQKVSVEPPKQVEDPGFVDVIQDLFQPVNDSIKVSNEKIHEQVEGSEMTQHGDVYVETEDKEHKKRVRVDLGKFRSLKEAGWKRKAIAEELNCSIGTVNKYWHEV